jgi:hypothetical protein
LHHGIGKRKEREMGYWSCKYGQRSQEFIDGVKAGITRYSYLHNGIRVVGDCEDLLEDVLEDVQKDLEPRKGER